MPAEIEVARQLLARNGGRMWLDREAGAQAWHLALPEAGPHTVLVIDDNQAAIRLFERYLTGQEFRVVGANEGEQALQLAQTLQPSVITLDLMMPRRDGWQILQALKEQPGVAHIPVLICSVLQDHELARTLGAAGCLRKPVSRETLLEALRDLLQRPLPGPTR